MPSSRASKTTQERVIFSLPKQVVADVQRYARIFREGNKSGFVADAIRSHISHLHKANHTRKLRHSYAAAAAETRKSVSEWETVSEETWAKLDDLDEGKHSK